MRIFTIIIFTNHHAFLSFIRIPLHHVKQALSDNRRFYCIFDN